MEIILASILGGVGYLLTKDDNQKTTGDTEHYSELNWSKPNWNNLNKYNNTYKNDQSIITNANRNLLHEVDKNYTNAKNNKNKVIGQYYNKGILNIPYETKSTEVPYESKSTEVQSTLTGEKIKQFSHNNMTPFFGSCVKQNMNDNSNETILDLHTGKSKYSMEKDSNENFYSLKHDVNVNGTKNVTSELMNRYILGDKKTNEGPIESIIVGPGLNNGFSSKPSGGFQQADVLDIIKPKTVDELRGLSAPKISYKGRIITGKYMTDKPSVPGELNQKKPSRVFKHGQKRLFTSASTQLKPASQACIIIKDTNRKTTMSSYTGIPTNSTKKQHAGENYQPSEKIVYKTSGVRNVNVTDKWNNNKMNNYGKDTITITDNERTNTLEKNHITNITSIVKALIAPIQDVFKTSRKENFIGNNRETGNFKSNQPNQYVHDPNNLARTTIKETNIHNTHVGNMDSNNKGVVYDPNDVARTTIKETSIHNNHMGNMDSNDKGIIYDPNNVARTTIKETSIHNNHTGNMDSNDKGVVYDPNNVTRTTIKETSIHNNHTGNMDSNDKGVVYDPNNIARTTIKETSIHNNHTGNMYSNDKGVVYDPNNVARTTIKETSIHNNHTGNMDSNDKGVVYDPNDVARTTIKETNIHNNHTGNMYSNDKGVVYDPNDVARTTIKETNIHNTHTGNVNVYTKASVHDPTMVARTTIKETTCTKVRNGNLAGPNKLFVYDPNNITKTTIKETTIENNRKGNYSNRENLKGGYLINSDEAPNTNRQFTTVDYTGIINSDSKGTNGYLISNQEVGNTNRQFTSSEYGGTAGSINSQHMSYFDKYNMRHTKLREDTLRERKPTNCNVTLANGKESINIDSNKLSQNENFRSNQQGKIYSLHQNLDNCNITKPKLHLDDSAIIERINPTTLDAFNKNPYTKSLKSYGLN